MQRNVYLWKIPIIKVKKTANYEKRYFLGIQYKVRKYMRRYNDFLEAFAENTSGISNRNIELILNNLGEAVIYARTHQYWHKSDALVFGSMPQHQAIFKMFAPEVPVFYCGEGPLEKPKSDNNGNSFKAILYSEETINMIKSGEPFFNSWQKHIGADLSKENYSKAIISPEAELSAMQKAKTLGINMDKFVFLMPFARSQDLLPKSFWVDIEQALKSKGYDVVHNTRIFTIEESYVLASRSKAIIALRSGFNDALSELEVPQHIIYSRLYWYGDIQPIYSLEQFPWSAKGYITEYNLQKQDIEKIKQCILGAVYEI